MNNIFLTIKITIRFELIRVKISHFVLRKNHNSFWGLYMGHHLKAKGLIPNGNRPLIFVGVAGFEPTTPCSQSRCANRTNYEKAFDRFLSG